MSISDARVVMWLLLCVTRILFSLKARNIFSVVLKSSSVVRKEFVIGMNNFQAPQEGVRAVNHGRGSSVFSFVGFFPDFRVGFVTAQTERFERNEVCVFFIISFGGGGCIATFVLFEDGDALLGVFDAPLESGFAGKRQRGGWEWR